MINDIAVLKMGPHMFPVSIIHVTFCYIQVDHVVVFFMIIVFVKINQGELIVYFQLLNIIFMRTV